jgi:hypothetical protein
MKMTKLDVERGRQQRKASRERDEKEAGRHQPRDEKGPRKIAERKMLPLYSFSCKEGDLSLWLNSISIAVTSQSYFPTLWLFSTSYFMKKTTQS